MKKTLKRINYRLLLVFLMPVFFTSCSEILLEKDISDKTVVLIAPANNSQLFFTGVAFSWESVEDATKYTLQIARPNFTSPTQIVLDTTITNTSFTQQLPIGNYEWRVKASNESYNTVYTSRLISIVSNDDFQSNTVSLISPVNNLITNTTAQNLSWQSVIGAITYQVQVYDSSNALVLDQNTTNTNYNYTFPEGSFQWRVRASNGTDTTLYSTRSALIDITAPNTPTLTSPINGGTSSTAVSFQWSRTSITGSTEKDKIYIYTNSTLTTLLSETEATSPYETTLTAGTYYWKIKAFDTAGNTGNDSSVFTLTVN